MEKFAIALVSLFIVAAVVALAQTEKPATLPTSAPACAKRTGDTMNSSGEVPKSVESSIAAFEERRKLLLENTAGQDVSAEQVADIATDIFSNRAIANLVLGRHTKAANARLRYTAEWFDHPHPKGKDRRGECDFVAIKLCLAWHLFKGGDQLEQETRDQIKRFFLTNDFQSKYPSENHLLLFRTSRYLMAGEFPGEKFAAYRREGRELAAEDRDWIKAYIRFRARRGWGEFDSASYLVPDWKCLTCLHDYAPDADLKHLAGQMLDLLLADMAVDSLRGMYCGAHGRIYAHQALEHRMEGTWPLQFLYFGSFTAQDLGTTATRVDALVSGYRPRDILVDIALNRQAPYENRERKHLHNTDDVRPEKPLAGSIRKYTWWTPQYVMGCVQLQDPYPAACKGAWYAHHEQHQWDLSFAASTRARIFTHHPGTSGNEHGYWTGDINCGCGHFFQNKTALVGLYQIPEKEPHQFIHAYLPKAEFDEVVEEQGWIFVRSGPSCAALKMLGGHKWAEQHEWKKNLRGGLDSLDWKDCEVISEGGRNGVVCETGLADDFGGFAAFRKEIVANRLDFDREKMTLTYESKRAGKLFIDTQGARRLDGQPADLNYATYDCPYLQSKWDSGIVDIIKGDRRVRLDFTDKTEGEADGNR